MNVDEQKAWEKRRAESMDPTEGFPERLAAPTRPGEGHAFACHAPTCSTRLYGSTARGALMAAQRHVTAEHPELSPVYVDEQHLDHLAKLLGG